MTIFRERRVVKTELQPELLEKLLNLPNGYEIFDANWNKDTNTLILYIKGDNLEVVPLGCECYSTRPEIEVISKFKFKWIGLE